MTITRLKRVSYGELQLGDVFIYERDEFDGKTVVMAEVTRVESDHLLATTADDLTLWLDKDTTYDAKIWVEVSE